MEPEELKLACLHHANGDIDKAKTLFEWVSGEVTTITGSPVSAPHDIRQMVDRFLAWKLPADFDPDGGISFKPTYKNSHGDPVRRDPSGTNLFTGVQAEAMVRHMLGAL